MWLSGSLLKEGERLVVKDDLGSKKGFFIRSEGPERI